MKLFIDIGNTRLKWMLYEDADTLVTGAWTHGDVPEQMTIWRGLDLQGAWLASVAQESLAAQVSDFLMAMGVAVQRVATQPEQAGVVNAYADYRKLGVDRWLSLLAARQHIPGRAVVVSVGTAMTIDVLEPSGQHRGGLILPGLRLMRESLSQGASLLPLVKGGHWQLGTSTEAAIAGGTLGALTSTLEAVLAEYLPSDEGGTSEEGYCVITGGDGELVYNALADTWQQCASLEPDWIFSGLLIAAM